MSLDPELSQGFWAQGAQTHMRAPVTAAQYGLYPQPGGLAGTGGAMPVKVGRLRQGGYAKCDSLEGLCAPVDPLSGRQLAERPCQPPDDLFNCYYTTNPTPARAMQMAALSSEPFGSVMKTVYSQPNYGDAVQTFFAGKV
jgi:hypothetical protein